MLLQIRVALLQITTMCYYELRQLYQIITNYGNTLLQITACITNYDVITNYAVTLKNSVKEFAFSKNAVHLRLY